MSYFLHTSFRDMIPDGHDALWSCCQWGRDPRVERRWFTHDIDYGGLENLRETPTPGPNRRFRTAFAYDNASVLRRDDVFRYQLLVGSDPFGFVDGVGQFDVFALGQSHGDGRGR